MKMGAYDQMEELGLRSERMYITTCEGVLVTDNFNRDLCGKLIRNGTAMYDVISRYEFLATTAVSRDMTTIGNRARMIVPFLKAYGINDHMALEFARETFNPMPDTKESMGYLSGLMPTFLLSSAFDHFSMVVRDALSFDPADLFFSNLEFDSFEIDRMESKQLREMADSIAKMRIPDSYDVKDGLLEDDMNILIALDEIFMDKIPEMRCFSEISALTACGASEKSYEMLEYRKNAEIDVNNTVFVGNDYEDRICMGLVKEADGLSIAFNGDAEAIKNCNVAVIGDTETPLVALAAEFYDYGIDSVFDMADNWNKEYIDKRICSDRNVINTLLEQSKKKLPTVVRVTRDNVKDVIEQSLAYRKKMEERFKRRW